jgi:hypothetical protein
MTHFVRYILIVAFIVCPVIVAAQSVDSNIKAAKTAAAAAIKSDPNKHPDSLRWTTGGNASINFSQTWLSNWSAGGEPTFTFNSSLNAFANYKKNKFFWENNTFLAYGIIKKGDYKAIKNNDQINIGSRIGYQMAKKWYYSAVFLGKSQFTAGYQYLATDTTRISDFLAPAYFYLSLGFDFKPSSRFSTHLSPVMGKTTLVRSDDETVLKTAGLSQELIDKNKHARYEFGGGIVFNLNGDFLSKKVTYITQLELFSNYLESPQDIDITWDFQFRIALAKYVSSSVRINMIYDNDQKTVIKEKNAEGVMANVSHGAKLQVKEFFEIGFFYSF